jgi:hypothetical protein
MARLDSASRLRWPRRIMVSMTSLRNRLAEAPSPSSPLRSRYSQAIWNESSRSWESETVMSKKTNENRSRSLSSPLRRSLSYFDRNRLGPKDDIAEHVGLRRVQGIADREARIPPIASACDLPSLLLGVPCDSLACRLAFCTSKRNTWTSHSPCKSESLLCAKRPEPPGGRMDSSRQERSRC